MDKNCKYNQIIISHVKHKFLKWQNFEGNTLKTNKKMLPSFSTKKANLC